MAAPSELDVTYVARLARLRLTSEEADLFQKQLADVLRYAAKLQKIDLSAGSHTLPPGSSALRRDEPVEGLSAEEALANAPRQAKNLFIVPRVLE